MVNSVSVSTQGKPSKALVSTDGSRVCPSFLVASDVFVASLPPPSKDNPEPVQHVFSSGADDSSFDVYPDPRGNTLGHGTEITLILKEDATEFLREKKIRDLVYVFPVNLLSKSTHRALIV